MNNTEELIWLYADLEEIIDMAGSEDHESRGPHQQGVPV